MPRAPSATKRQQGAANHRDTRHENGLVGPGKRVQKQKSNGHINGHVKSSEGLPPTPPLPATPPATNGHAQGAYTDNTNDHKLQVNGLRRYSVSVYSETSSSESSSMPVLTVNDENHRQIDVNASKHPFVHRDSGPLSMVATVLRSCPLSDTIAILIVLLQLPPTFLSIIHILFATLTFVPPSNSTTSGLSFSDMFEGTTGTPALATMVLVDIFVLLIWLFLWSPVQDIVLDLAQTVIALTLGGGTSSSEAGINNIIVSFSIVGISQLLRNGAVKQSGLRALVSSSTKGLLGSPDPDDPLEPIPHSMSDKGAHGWIRSILAIHILTQGVVRFIRDLYVRNSKQNTSANLLDPEAGNSDAPAQTPDNEASNPPIRSLNTKKKRKQSAQVRVRQPLWAALASTKIVMVKEYETSHTAAESAGTNATDINNLGNAPFNTEADRIWITYVGNDQVFFATSFFPTHKPQENSQESSTEPLEDDKTKPFYVRVNKTRWTATKIYSAISPDQSAGQDKRWNGEIFGLTPMSSYECEFISTTDETLIFSTSVRTVQTQLDLSANGLSPGTFVTGRPGSPITTLKTSIASSEVKLAEERNRQKRERKEARQKHSGIRKEIMNLVSVIESSGGSDKQRQRVQQLTSTKQQNDSTIDLLDAQIDALSALPTTAELNNREAARSQYESEKDVHKKAREAYQALKSQIQEEAQGLANDVTNLVSKRERFQSRITKLSGELERIADANARGLDEAQRKCAEQEAKKVERQNLEDIFNRKLFGISTDLGENIMLLENLKGLVAQLQFLEQSEMQYSHSPTALVSNHGYVDVPEGPTASNYPWNSTPNTGFHNSATMPSSLNPGLRSRGRSSSMLSDVSGFTQSSDEGEPPPQVLPNLYIRERHGSSEGTSLSGSGSRSGNGSVSDPKSPIVGNGSARRWASGNGSVVEDKAIIDER